MKTFLSIILTLFSSMLICQSFAKIQTVKDIYVYNNSKDTIYLSSIFSRGFSTCGDLKVFDEVQIDGKGSQEIIFHRTCSNFISDHGGTFDIDETISISKYEIWNLDTKTMTFEAVHSYKSNYNTFMAYQTPKHKKGNESYSYDFSIDKKGVITISNCKSSGQAFKVEWKTIKKKGKAETVVIETPYPVEVSPDKKEGIYKYVNGAYELQQ